MGDITHHPCAGKLVYLPTTSDFFQSSFEFALLFCFCIDHRRGDGINHLGLSPMFLTEFDELSNHFHTTHGQISVAMSHMTCQRIDGNGRREIGQVLDGGQTSGCDLQRNAALVSRRVAFTFCFMLSRHSFSPSGVNPDKSATSSLAHCK